MDWKNYHLHIFAKGNLQYGNVSAEDFGTSDINDVLSHVPICIKGKKMCPFEDSDGLWGYYEKLENVRDVNNPEREELLDWLMRDIEERKYDLKAINLRLANLYS